MSQPTPYTPTTDFEAELGSAHGTHLNAEFANIKQTLSQLLANIAKVQRDDTKLANLTVHPDSLTSATMSLLGTKWTPKGLWASAANYVVGDVVESSGNSYVCAAIHVSGVFATDKAAGKWVTIYQPLSGLGLAAGSIAFTPSGTVSSTDVQSAIAEVAGEAAQKAQNLSDLPNKPTALANLGGLAAAGGAMSGALLEAQGASIAAGGTVNLAAATGNYVQITGAATVSSLGTVQGGAEFTLEFLGVCTLTHNATSLKLPGSANITTAAGDVAKFVSLGSGNWKCVDYQSVSVPPFSSVLAFLPLAGGTMTGDIAMGGNITMSNKRIIQAKGADVASASTVDLSTVTGNFVSVTGTTGITSFGTVQAGAEFTIEFVGVLTITYNATSMKLPGNANVTTAAGDTAIFRSLGGGNWKCVNYQRQATAA